MESDLTQILKLDNSVSLAKRCRNLDWLFVTAVVLTSLMVPNASAQSNPIGLVPHTAPQIILDMGRPRLMTYNPHYAYVLGNQTANVLVDINSTIPIAEVTLFYVVSPSGTLPPRPVWSSGDRSLPNSTAKQMQLWTGNYTRGSFYTEIPHSVFGNNTVVYGYAKALDKKGNSNNTLNYYSDTFIYNAYTPNPTSSSLELDFYMIDVDPKTLHMNLTINSTVFFLIPTDLET